jgi:hypothetical protein
MQLGPIIFWGSCSMQEIDTRYPSNKSPLLRVPRFISRLLIGEYLKTAFYLNTVDLAVHEIKSTL